MKHTRRLDVEKNCPVVGEEFGSDLESVQPRDLEQELVRRVGGEK